MPVVIFRHAIHDIERNMVNVEFIAIDCQSNRLRRIPGCSLHNAHILSKQIYKEEVKSSLSNSLSLEVHECSFQSSQFFNQKYDNGTRLECSTPACTGVFIMLVMTSVGTRFHVASGVFHGKK